MARRKIIVDPDKPFRLGEAMDRHRGEWIVSIGCAEHMWTRPREDCLACREVRGEMRARRAAARAFDEQRAHAKARAAKSGSKGGATSRADTARSFIAWVAARHSRRRDAGLWPWLQDAARELEDRWERDGFTHKGRAIVRVDVTRTSVDLFADYLGKNRVGGWGRRAIELSVRSKAG